MPAQKTPLALPFHLLVFEERLRQIERLRSIYTLLTIFSTLFIVWFGMNVASESNASSLSRGISKLFDYPFDMTEDAWNYGWGWWSIVFKYLPELISTFNIALFSTCLGSLLAIILSCLASANLINSTFVIQVIRRTMDFFRSFPEIVFAMIFLYLIGKNELPAILAITIHTTGALGKLFSEVIENIDVKPLDGLRSTGGSWVKRVRFAVLPQVLPSFFSYALLRLEINVRASTILGFVGAGGIGEALYTVIQWRHGAEVTAIMALLVTTIIFLDYCSTYLRIYLVESHR